MSIPNSKLWSILVSFVMVLTAVVILEVLRKQQVFALALIVSAVGFLVTLNVLSVDGFIGGTPDIPSGAPSQDRETGLGDINYSLYFSPADAKGMI